MIALKKLKTEGMKMKKGKEGKVKKRKIEKMEIIKGKRKLRS